MLHVVPHDPFENPAATLAFLEAVEPLKRAKLSVAELDYVLRHHRDDVDPVELDDAAVDEILAAIAQAITEGEAAIEAVQGELTEVVAAHLDAVLAGPVDVSAWMAILDLDPGAIGAAELDVLAAGLTGVVEDPETVAQQIADASGEARLALVRDVLIAFRRAQVREPALCGVLGERLQLDAAAVRTLLFEIVHEGESRAAQCFCPTGARPRFHGPGVRPMDKGALVIPGVQIKTGRLPGVFRGGTKPGAGREFRTACPSKGNKRGRENFPGVFAGL